MSKKGCGCGWSDNMIAEAANKALDSGLTPEMLFDELKTQIAKVTSELSGRDRLKGKQALAVLHTTKTNILGFLEDNYGSSS